MCVTLRVQVPNNHILTQNLYYNFYYPKYLNIGYMGLYGNWTLTKNALSAGRATPHAGLEIREGKGMGVYVKVVSGYGLRA